MEETLHSTVFWYAVSVALFVVFALLKIRTPITGWLDSEITKVRAELDEAKKLHAEAQATLEEYRKRQDDAHKEAEEILMKAKEDAERLRQKAEEDLEANIKHQEALFASRVHVAQEEAFDEVRSFVIDEVLIEAEGKLKKMASSDQTRDLLTRIIEDLPKLKKRKSA